MALYGAPLTLPMFFPALPQAGIGKSFFLQSRLAFLGFYSGGALLAHLQTVVPYTLVLLRSALRRFLGRWYLTYQRAPLVAVDQSDDVPALRQVIVGFPFTLGHLHIQASLPRLLLWWHSPRAPSVGGTLHSGAIRGVLCPWCLRQRRSSTAFF